MAPPVEHHWNGQWGWARLDIYLERGGDSWRVRALEFYGRPGYQTLIYEGLTEEQGRLVVEYLLHTADPPATGSWQWRDIAAGHRRYD
jgi:hypothetical protein